MRPRDIARLVKRDEKRKRIASMAKSAARFTATTLEKRAVIGPKVTTGWRREGKGYSSLVQRTMVGRGTDNAYQYQQDKITTRTTVRSKPPSGNRTLWT